MLIYKVLFFFYILVFVRDSGYFITVLYIGHEKLSHKGRSYYDFGLFSCPVNQLTTCHALYTHQEKHRFGQALTIDKISYRTL